ncbi:MAG: Hsp20/alpha crystallin family protein [Gammaproteobacteria bacterium]|jgi:HSP20 family protein|nr:Hsp20/alpha crystallin family protein [Gammaproteobacteria bacterium]MDP6615653.1 Hsp20/alpha crystallin family protein [Gammaproteobacteria bacterium]MDP6694680.1 Hsp20/alpha crystallin family protein [Gammaproteobacteria bacterium]
MNIMRYEPRYRPLGLLGRLLQDPELDRLVNSEADSVSDWLPAVDIREEKDRYLLRADLPGVDPNDIDVTMENGVLTIQGRREQGLDESEEGFRRFERVTGSFLRRFTLPDTADGDSIKARTNHGVLEVSIDKQAKSRPRKVEVKAA